MGNFVTYEARPDLERIRMSNGLTSVFVSVLSLAASSLAESDWQRQLAVWFASNDQSLTGRGTVSFDIGELPWSRETFVGDRAFVLRVIEAAKAKAGWERLGYEPSEERLQPCLDQFRAMVEAFVAEHASSEETTSWPFGPST